jgi:RNA polymerase sigma-70 factor (ECF subfamily)
LSAQTKDIHPDIIRKCRENDKNAQFEIYKFYFKTMYNTTLRIVKNTAEAEDIMQDSFLDAFSKIGSYTGEGNFGGWLRKIVVNNSIDALKKKNVNLSFEDVHMDVVVETENQIDDIEYKIDEIKKAMEKLKEENRIIISLFLFEGYDHEEISQILNISYNASRTRYSRARKKLLQVLSDQRSFMFHPN